MSPSTASAPRARSEFVVVGVLALLASAVFCAGPVVLACSIPVFRYALERWARDRYEVTVFHRGPLGPEEAASLRGLLARSAGVTPPGGEERHGFANATVRVLDVSGELDGAARRLWQSQRTTELPRMALRYPRSFGLDKTLWASPLSERSVESLFDSPARREIARRILKGDCAVWVLLECGKAEEDEAAASFLKAELVRLEKTLQLPELDPWDFGAESEEELPELRATFSMVRVTRTDPEEAVLREILLASEADLAGLDEPMAFPVFGRGRVLCALVGKGINADNVLEVCGFLVGPCSCVVKAQNPGVDLLTSVDWDGVLAGSLVVDEHLPPLVGFPGPGEPPPRLDAEPEPTPADGESGGAGAVFRNTVIALAVGVVLVVAGSILIARRRKG